MVEPDITNLVSIHFLIMIFKPSLNGKMQFFPASVGQLETTGGLVGVGVTGGIKRNINIIYNISIKVFFMLTIVSTLCHVTVVVLFVGSIRLERGCTPVLPLVRGALFVRC